MKNRDSEERVFRSVDDVCLIRILNKFNVHRLDTNLFEIVDKEKRLSIDYSKDTIKIKISIEYLKKFLKMLDKDEDTLILYVKKDTPIKMRTVRKMCYIAPRLDYDIIEVEKYAKHKQGEQDG